MKKYFMAFVDFSEIASVTTNEEANKNAKEGLVEHGFITKKGNVSASKIKSYSQTVVPEFVRKLRKRMKRYQGGIKVVRDTMQKFCDNKEYSAFYLYYIFLYGFLEWSVPDKIIWFGSSPEALRCFAAEVIAAFDSFIAEQSNERETDASDDL